MTYKIRITGTAAAGQARVLVLGAGVIGSTAQQARHHRTTPTPPKRHKSGRRGSPGCLEGAMTR